MSEEFLEACTDLVCGLVIVAVLLITGSAFLLALQALA